MVPSLRADVWGEYSVYLSTDRKIKLTHSVKSRFDNLCAFFNEGPFTRQEFNSFISQKQQSGTKNSTLNCYIKAAKLLDKFFIYKYADYVSQFKDYTYFKENRSLQDLDILTWIEMDLIANAHVHKDPISQNMWFTLVKLLSATGCRITEATSLKMSDVHPDFIIFRETKNGQDRRVKINDFIYQLLSDCTNGVYVFSPDGIRPTHERRAYQVIVAKAALATPKKVWPHLFRHSFITNMVLDGCPVPTVAEIVGHQDISVTSNYLHISLQNQENALYQHHPIYKKSQSFEMVKTRIRESVEKMLDKDRYRFEWVEDAGSMRFEFHIDDEKKIS